MADTLPPPNQDRTRRQRIRAIIHKPAEGDRLQFDVEALKDLLITVALPLLAIIATIWFAARFVQPAPANTFVMTTGPDGGAYHLYTQRYRDRLARENISITPQAIGRFDRKFAAPALSRFRRRGRARASGPGLRRCCGRITFTWSGLLRAIMAVLPRQ